MPASRREPTGGTGPIVDSEGDIRLLEDHQARLARDVEKVARDVEKIMEVIVELKDTMAEMRAETKETLARYGERVDNLVRSQREMTQEQSANRRLFVSILATTLVTVVLLLLQLVGVGAD
jgi:predicted  nucleic acid-binding Zn-ribbon protein